MTLSIPVCSTEWDNDTGHCCLATGQCLLCNSWDCGSMRQTDASSNTLQMDHKFFWQEFAIPFHIADEKAEGISVYREGLCFNLL